MRSQLRWFSWKEGLGPQGRAGEILSPNWSGNASAILPEELLEVVWDRNVWAYFPAEAATHMTPTRIRGWKMTIKTNKSNHISITFSQHPMRSLSQPSVTASLKCVGRDVFPKKGPVFIRLMHLGVSIHNSTLTKCRLCLKMSECSLSSNTWQVSSPLTASICKVVNISVHEISCW